MGKALSKLYQHSMLEKSLEGAILLQSFKKPLSLDEEQHYLKLSRSGDMTARNILVERNLRLVAHIVKKYNNMERDVEDLISIGTIGLIKAINTYDIEKGNRLVTYASRCIDNELLMMLRQERKCSKEVSLQEPVGTDKEGNEISLLDIISNPDLNVAESVMLYQDILKLYSYVDTMKDEREKKVIIMRYGLYGKKEFTQREIAEQLSISRSYVSRIEKKALQELGERFA